MAAHGQADQPDGDQLRDAVRRAPQRGAVARGDPQAPGGALPALSRARAGEPPAPARALLRDRPPLRPRPPSASPRAAGARRRGGASRAPRRSDRDTARPDEAAVGHLPDRPARRGLRAVGAHAPLHRRRGRAGAGDAVADRRGARGGRLPRPPRPPRRSAAGGSDRSGGRRHRRVGNGSGRSSDRRDPAGGLRDGARGHGAARTPGPRARARGPGSGRRADVGEAAVHPRRRRYRAAGRAWCGAEGGVDQAAGSGACQGHRARAGRHRQRRAARVSERRAPPPSARQRRGAPRDQGVRARSTCARPRSRSLASWATTSDWWS